MARRKIVTHILSSLSLFSFLSLRFQHVSSELNRFAVHDPRTEAQLMREASLAKQARRLRKAAKRKARAAQRKKMTEANDGGKFPDRASEAGDVHHQYEQQQKEGEEDMEMRRLHLGNAARAANADDESKTRRSETNQATARALATGRTSETRSNLGVRLPVGGKHCHTPAPCTRLLQRILCCCRALYPTEANERCTATRGSRKSEETA